MYKTQILVCIKTRYFIKQIWQNFIFLTHECEIYLQTKELSYCVGYLRTFAMVSLMANFWLKSYFANLGYVSCITVQSVYLIYSYFWQDKKHFKKFSMLIYFKIDQHNEFLKIGGLLSGPNCTTTYFLIHCTKKYVSNWIDPKVTFCF